MPSTPIRESQRGNGVNERSIRFDISHTLDNRLKPLTVNIPWREIFQDSQENLPVLEQMKQIQEYNPNLVNFVQKGSLKHPFRLCFNWKHPNDEETREAYYKVSVNNDVIPPEGLFIPVTEVDGIYGKEKAFVYTIPDKFIKAGLGEHIRKYCKVRDLIKKQNQEAAYGIVEFLKQEGTHDYAPKGTSYYDYYILRTWEQVFHLWPELRQLAAPARYQPSNSKPRLTQRFKDEFVPPEPELKRLVNVISTQAFMLEGAENLNKDMPSIEYKIQHS